ncbi:MAG: flagellar export chaperone FlgN [Nitrospira sp.]|nr:flagellar export chaperone FlgN [Nitrospira sp.]
MPSVSTALSAQLVTILLRELAACQSLLETVEAERHAIKTLAIGDFHPINVRRLAILEQLQSIADARDQTVRQIVLALSLPDSTASLHLLLDRWQGSEASTVRRHHETLMATAKHVREEIKQNVVLIDGIRGFVEHALTAGAAALTDGKAYNRTGKPALAHPSSAVLYQQG